jgi:hypothetical protein
MVNSDSAGRLLIPMASAISRTVGRSTEMPLTPSVRKRALTAPPPPAVRRTTSVALLSLIRSINSSRLRTDNATPGSSSKFDIVPLPGWRSLARRGIRLSRRTLPLSTSVRS